MVNRGLRSAAVWANLRGGATLRSACRSNSFDCQVKHDQPQEIMVSASSAPCLPVPLIFPIGLGATLPASSSLTPLSIPTHTTIRVPGSFLAVEWCSPQPQVACLAADRRFLELACYILVTIALRNCVKSYLLARRY